MDLSSLLVIAAIVLGTTAGVNLLLRGAGLMRHRLGTPLPDSRPSTRPSPLRIALFVGILSLLLFRWGMILHSDWAMSPADAAQPALSSSPAAAISGTFTVTREVRQGNTVTVYYWVRRTERVQPRIASTTWYGKAQTEPGLLGSWHTTQVSEGT